MKVFCNKSSTHAKSTTQILPVCLLGCNEPLLHSSGSIAPLAFDLLTNPELDTGRLYTERAGKTLPPGAGCSDATSGHAKHPAQGNGA
jgi:hypothetical protein